MAMVHVQQSSSPSILTVLQNVFSLHSALGKKKEKKKKEIWLLKQACAYFIFLYFFFKDFFFSSYGFKIHLAELNV